MKKYEDSWIDFASSLNAANSQIKFEDIPWLPTLLLKGPGNRESWKLVAVCEHSAFGDKKAALKTHTMRWHPDKFLQKYGNRVIPQDKEKVMEKVIRCSQRLNELRGRLERERRCDGNV